MQTFGRFLTRSRTGLSKLGGRPMLMRSAPRMFSNLALNARNSKKAPGILLGSGITFGAAAAGWAVCKEEQQVYTIVLTGGPCGGKSTAAKEFTKKLKNNGYDVYAMPEVPTILILGGCQYPGIKGGQKLVEFEVALLKLQIQMEESFRQVAKSTGRKSVILADRGLLDVAAYLPEDKWNEILASQGWTRDSFMSRYDMVVHLVTAANGAEKFYTTKNNAARSETVDEARALDNKMIGCWKGHPIHKIIGNETGFKGKLDKTTAAVTGLVNGEF